jgi:hypothetical protein
MAAGAVTVLTAGGASVLVPSSAGAATTDPLGPTIAQLEQFSAVSLAHLQQVIPTLEGTVNTCTPQIVLYGIELNLEGPSAGPPPLCES